MNDQVEKAKEVRKGLMAWAEKVGTNWLLAGTISGWALAVVFALLWAAK